MNDAKSVCFAVLRLVLWKQAKIGGRLATARKEIEHQ